MTVDVTTPRTRRAVIAAAIGGTAALAAATLARPFPAQATDGDTLQVGGTYTAETVTTLDVRGASAEDTIALKGVANGGSGVAGVSNWGDAVSGTSNDASGVLGHSDTYVGVFGDSTSGSGVCGFTTSSGNGAGVIGRAVGDSTGVAGISNPAGWSPGVPAKTGVFGYAAQDATARGVHGQTTAGRGVYGAATSGYGVRGYATSGTAVYAASANPLTGYALRAVGRVKLDKCAGLATIAAGTKSVVVTPGIDLVSTSAVVATLQGSAGGTTTVQRCAVNTTTNTFTIYLTANSTANVKVAWHVFG